MHFHMQQCCGETQWGLINAIRMTKYFEKQCCCINCGTVANFAVWAARLKNTINAELAGSAQEGGISACIRFSWSTHYTSIFYSGMFLSLLIPVTSSHGVWPPGSLWPSESGHARSHRQASPDSGRWHQRSWARLWVLGETQVQRRRLVGRRWFAFNSIKAQHSNSK